MPLTQVSMWTEHGWKRVFAEDIYKIYGGKISSKSCMFVCDICGQNVSLAKGDIRKPYFKHSRGDMIKNVVNVLLIILKTILFNLMNFQ